MGERANREVNGLLDLKVYTGTRHKNARVPRPVQAKVGADGLESQAKWLIHELFSPSRM